MTGGAIAAFVIVATWFTLLVGFRTGLHAAFRLVVPALRWGHPV